MNSIWNKNINAFTKRFPALSEFYSSEISHISQAFLDSEDIVSVTESLFPFWKIEIAKNGEYTAIENGVKLHSSYKPSAPLREEEDTKSFEDAVTVFLGAGLGYSLCAWCSKFKNRPVIFLEPDPARFFAALCILDWSSVFEVEKCVIALSCPLDQLIPLCENFSHQISYKLNPAFVKHNEDYFIQAKKLLDRNISKQEINRNTLKKFGKLWERNAERNLPYAKKCDGIKIYKDYFKGKDFLLIAAGPSLTNILPILKDLKKNLVLVCVDTALRTVLKAGVEPHFIVLTDPQYWAYRHIAGLKSLSSILIADAVSYPSVFRFPCKKIVISYSPFPVSENYKRIYEEKGELSSGGSVATVAWSFCEYAGASRIFTAGLDLSFPKKETHIKGSTFEQAVHTVSKRQNTAERCTCNLLFGADVNKSLDYRGSEVLTDSRMKMFAWWFESKVSSSKLVKTFTLCPESMMIPGIEWYKDIESLYK
ncbi:MAG: motility associated factor glycosyltransferase family protein [Treponema sp.]|nr:motility associated factor glycosyltransferase family protein [Treponema sp.]